MNTFRKTIVCSLASLVAFVPVAFAQGTYTQIDVPGAVAGTIAVGIDKAGDVVGFYDAIGGGYYNGFLLKNGSYETIDYPFASSTQIGGINNAGTQLVGNSSTTVGFVYEIQTGTFTTISYPAADYTIPFAVNDAGAVVGYAARQTAQIGFELISSRYLRIVPPGGTGTAVRGVSNAGQLVGISNITNQSQNFLFNHGKYRLVAIPASEAFVQGINPAGTALVGYYYPSQNVAAGFLYQNKTLTTLQFPGSNTTFASGINSAGEVVGTFSDANGAHGFTWTPPGDVAKK